MKKKKGIVAAGHAETARAAAEVLSDGGNAFDAVVAAHFTACVAEPVLSSLGGGGFLLAKDQNGAEKVYDFFVQTPLSTKEPGDINFFPITADFGSASQEFHIGFGSIATPGTVKGLFKIHEEHCTLPMKRLVEPAVSLAKKGLRLNRFQAEVLNIISPIYLAYPGVRQLFESREWPGSIIRDGEIINMSVMADFIEALAKEGEALFYRGEFAKKTARLCRENGGLLSEMDFKEYKVVKREPLKTEYRKHGISINPPPCAGGIMTLFALKLLESELPHDSEPGSFKTTRLMAEVQAATELARLDSLEEESAEFEAHILDQEYRSLYLQNIRERLKSTRGTTQISITDQFGNLASLTTSNGEGSGIMIPGTGVVLNNMLGEEDLNPNGFHGWMCNRRMTSMMSPGILTRPDGTEIAFGSGGSNRIRTAILQVLVNMIDFGMNLEQAISSPRLHFEKNQLNIEQGFTGNVVEQLCCRYINHKQWDQKSLFFGGVHAVSKKGNEFDGFGDPRRGGVCLMV